MFFILLLAIPVAGAAVAYLTQRLPIVSLATGLLFLAADAFVVVLGDFSARSEIAGIGLAIGPLGQTFVLLFLGVVAISMVLAWESAGIGGFATPVLGTLSLVIAAVVVQNPFVAIFLLEAASFLIVFSALEMGDEEHLPVAPFSAILKYVILMTVASLLLTAGFIFGERYGFDQSQVALLKLIVATLSIGFALRLGVVPFHLWVPSLAEHAFLPVFAIVASVLSPAVVFFLIVTIRYLPILPRTEATAGVVPLMIVSVAVTAFAALLAFPQGDLKRLLAYAAIYEAGYMLTGVASLSRLGITGAIFQAINYAVLVLLMTVSIGAVRRVAGKTEYRELGGLVRAAPVTSLGFIVSSLGLVGLPPFGGFVGKYMILQAAGLASVTVLLLMLATSFAGLAFYLRAIHSAFVGVQRWETIGRESIASCAIIGLLIVVSVFLGLHPQPVLDVIRGAVEELALVSL